MIKLQEIIGLPTLEWHVTHKRTLSENVYRYSSESFIQLFAEARQAWRDGKIQLNEFDEQLLRETDIGEYGMFEGQKVPLDLPMVNESDEYYDSLEDAVAQNEFGLDYDQLGPNEKEWVDDELSNLNEAEYKGRKVSLNKPKRGGPKKFFVYVKNPKTGNVKKVNFGDSGNLTVKLKEPGARASFAARHKCSTKKDKTKPGYWSCNIGRYWKSLGGSKNFSGYW